MSAAKKRWFPFTAEQSVNILSEFGPLVTMFIVNAITGSVNYGALALIITTVLAMIVMRIVLGRLPIFPVIASAVTIGFAALTWWTGDAWYIKKKVTIFNVMFGLFLLYGLWRKQNFFKHVFEKTFHYTDEGWNRFTLSFSLFFFLTAILNEVIIQAFNDKQIYDVLGHQMDGVSIWILFKVAFIMPLSGLYAWYLTRVMQKYRIEEPQPAEATAAIPAGLRRAETG